MGKFSVAVVFGVLACSGACDYIEAGEESRREYLELAHLYPKFLGNPGDISRGEIQIIVDPIEMANIEYETSKDVGVLMRSNHWIWVNDACLYPNGTRGVSGRLVATQSLESRLSLAIMPMLPDGRIVLSCKYRHATRSWELEIPRGFANAEEDIGAAAQRVVAEQTGMLVDDLSYLGDMIPESSVDGAIVPVFVGTVVGMQNAQPDDTQPIEVFLISNIPEIKRAFYQGFYEVDIRGSKVLVPFRDPVLAYALFKVSLVIEAMQQAQQASASQEPQAAAP
jgi:ADP-ribose pyrophosphatase